MAMRVTLQIDAKKTSSRAPQRIAVASEDPSGRHQDGCFPLLATTRPT
jgi:hypothetical protein